MVTGPSQAVGAEDRWVSWTWRCHCIRKLFWC